MENDVAIRTKGLGKRYQLGQTVNLQRTFRETLMSLPRHLGRIAARKPRPAANATSFPRRESSDIFWALRDLDLEIQHGEAVGIIGRNGAGKSTLLKILSRITTPTTGIAEIRGRVGSLLEVGTGFHPELTGRENIYLNGAILGMRKQEIDRKFDEIVAFAEVERFLDTPVKRYSSGMRVRLGFAVAAHLDPEILIVDEVLSVGDAAFRKRCLGKMDTVARGGRTVLFVSHNMAAVQNLCSRAILLVDGRQEVNGTPENVIAAYLEKTEEWADQEGGYFVNRDLLQSQARKDIRFTDIQILDEIGSLAKTVRTGQKLVVRMHYETTDRIASPAFGVMLETDYGQEVFRLTTTPISGFLIDNLGKKGSVDLTIDWLPLTAGRCRLSVLFLHRGGQPYIHLDQVIIFDVQPCDVYNSGLALERNRGLIVLPHSWRHQILEAPLEEPC